MIKYTLLDEEIKFFGEQKMYGFVGFGWVIKWVASPIFYPFQIIGYYITKLRDND